jgi:hypothetical protein
MGGLLGSVLLGSLPVPGFSPLFIFPALHFLS